MPESGEEARRSPVVWRPEDAANFLAAAIRESQKPLTDALKRPAVPLSVFALVMLVVVLAGVGVFFFMQDERQDLRALQDEVAEGRAAQRRLETLAVEQADLRQRLQQAQEEVSRWRRSHDELAVRMGTLEETKQRAASMQQREAALAEDLRRTRERLRSFEEQYAALQKQAQARAGEAERTRTQMRFQQTEMEGLRDEIAALEKQLDASRRMIRSLHESVLGQPSDLQDSSAAGSPRRLRPQPRNDLAAPSSTPPGPIEWEEQTLRPEVRVRELPQLAPRQAARQDSSAVRDTDSITEPFTPEEAAPAPAVAAPAAGDAVSEADQETATGLESDPAPAGADAQGAEPRGAAAGTATEDAAAVEKPDAQQSAPAAPAPQGPVFGPPLPPQGPSTI